MLVHVVRNEWKAGARLCVRVGRQKEHGGKRLKPDGHASNDTRQQRYGGDGGAPPPALHVGVHDLVLGVQVGQRLGHVSRHLPPAAAEGRNEWQAGSVACTSEGTAADGRAC